MSTPVDTIYNQRKDFIIVALTGITGSGCSAFAEAMSMPFGKWVEKGLIRDVSLPGITHNERKQEIFRREYALCYNFCEKNYDAKGRFVIIKYRNVLLYCMLESLTSQTEIPEEVRAMVCDILKRKFDKSREKDPEKNMDRDYPAVDNTFSTEDVYKLGITDDLLKLFWEAKYPGKEREEIYRLFFSEPFVGFCEAFYDELKRRDYYAKNFFVHRLAFSFRAAGHPFEEYNKKKDYGHDNLFYVVEKINDIIKGCHQAEPDKERRFVIDSIRNSMELLFLRERYNSFYSIALHNDGREEGLVKTKVRKAIGATAESKELCNKADFIAKKMMNLSAIEGEKDDFEEGKFFSPDISRCVTESELHIRFYEEDDPTTFKSYTEQWMKYISLILHPGIVAPTRDERCMSVAYVAKFNSGCISCQVGCVIVGKDYTIKSIGWNDPPAPQLPCSLRFVDEVCDDERCKECNEGNRIYSKFEIQDTQHYRVKDCDGNVQYEEDGFKACLAHETHESLDAVIGVGQSYPYCFRSRYNKYKGNKDAVNTRSLHAEENTMLRITKMGGVGLDGGIMFVTASPCILCSKKAYQIGIKEIVYLDPYTDIAPELILMCGYDQPKLRPFMGAIGETFYKLYQPFMPYKDELALWEKKGGGKA